MPKQITVSSDIVTNLYDDPVLADFSKPPKRVQETHSLATLEE
jgi:hypothetical protein